MAEVFSRANNNSTNMTNSNISQMKNKKIEESKENEQHDFELEKAIQNYVKISGSKF